MTEPAGKSTISCGEALRLASKMNEALAIENQRYRTALRELAKVHNGSTARSIAGKALWPTEEDWIADGRP